MAWSDASRSRTKGSGWGRRIARSAAAVVVFSTVGVVVPIGAGAATFTVDTTADVVDGGDGLLSLREAVAAANANGVDDTIELAAATTYQLTLCAGGVLEHTDTASLTIEGNGSTIEQTCADEPILSSTDSAATSVLAVVDATLTGGPNTGTTISGAAASSDGRLVLDGVTISGVDAGASGSVLFSEFGGGGAPTIWVMDSQITGNTGRAVAGSFVSATVEGSTVSGNTGSGVGLVDGSPLVVTDSTIDGNGGRGVSTTGQGGTRVTITDSQVTGNTQGGVSCGACASLEIEGSDISDNGVGASAGSGGGITFSFDYDPVPTDPGIDITDSTISGNDANHAGGGISVTTIEASGGGMAQPSLTLSGASITDNRTLGDDVPGGGIHMATGGLQAVSTDIDGNEAGVGGATASRGGGVHMAETSDDGIADGRDLALAGVSISDNTAAGRGGGTELSLDGRMEATQLTVADNASGQSGGGLSLVADRADIDTSRFSANTAADGAGLSLRGFSDTEVVLDSSTVDANVATGEGGGLLVDDVDRVELVNSTVSGNTAAEGGGLYVGDDPMDEPETAALLHTTVAANTATTGSNVRAVEGTVETEAALIVDGIGGASCVADGSNIVGSGYSFVDDAACADDATDVVSIEDPQLAALADNGGGTPTHVPAAASPIGGVVPVGSCSLTDDQRGVARPQGDDCEPGSVEIEESGGAGAIEGTEGPDLLVGTDGDDLIEALGGGDLVIALDGDDMVDGAGGADVLLGGSGDDELLGGPGADLLVGGPGADDLVGGPGRDILIGDAADTLVGGPGRDICIGGGLPFGADC